MKRSFGLLANSGPDLGSLGEPVATKSFRLLATLGLGCKSLILADLTDNADNKAFNHFQFYGLRTWFFILPIRKTILYA